MNQRNIFIGIIIVLVIGTVGYFVFVKNKATISPAGNNPSPSNSSQPVIPNFSTEEKILEIALEVNAPFSTAKLSIFEDGSALYSEKMDGKSE